MPDGPWVKQNMSYVLNFTKGGSPHVHSFIWIFNAQNIQNEASYIFFIEKSINAQLPNQLNDPEVFELRLANIMFTLEHFSKHFPS